MGIVWEAYHRVPLLGVPENPIDFIDFTHRRPPAVAMPNDRVKDLVPDQQ